MAARDAFDFDWVRDFAPKKIVETVTLVAVVVLAVVPSARVWFIDQATRHAQHEIQPLIDELTKMTVPTAPTHRLPPRGREAVR